MKIRGESKTICALCSVSIVYHWTKPRYCQSCCRIELTCSYAGCGQKYYRQRTWHDAAAKDNPNYLHYCSGSCRNKDRDRTKNSGQPRTMMARKKGKRGKLDTDVMIALYGRDTEYYQYQRVTTHWPIFWERSLDDTGKAPITVLPSIRQQLSVIRNINSRSNGKDAPGPVMPRR